MEIGDTVQYIDEVGVSHQGLVTASHGPQCINLIYVSSDPAKSDPYGRQIERASSVQKEAEWTAHGRFYREV